MQTSSKKTFSKHFSEIISCNASDQLFIHTSILLLIPNHANFLKPVFRISRATTEAKLYFVECLSKTRIFFNNVFYLNEVLFGFGKSPSPLCSFCKLHGETLMHIFSSCNRVISLYIKKNYFFSEYIQLTVVSTDCHFQSKGNDKSFLIQNMILMLFKLYVYKSKVSGTLNFHVLLPSSTGQS